MQANDILSIITPELYGRLLFRERLPEYETFARFIEYFTSEEGRQYNICPIHEVQLHRLNGNVLPVVEVQDEDISSPTYGQRIPTLLLEDIVPEFAWAWLSQFSPEDLHALGYYREWQGMGRVHIPPSANARRRRRDHARFNVEIHLKPCAIVSLLDAVLPLARDYWHQRAGVFDHWPDTTRYVDLYSCGGEVFAVSAATGSELHGVGFFTRYKDRVTWNFSYHGWSNGVGNAILYEGFKIAQSVNVPFDLGSNYYPFKHRWADDHYIKWTPSVRYLK